LSAFSCSAQSSYWDLLSYTHSQPFNNDSSLFRNDHVKSRTTFISYENDTAKPVISCIEQFDKQGRITKQLFLSSGDTVEFISCVYGSDGLKTQTLIGPQKKEKIISNYYYQNGKISKSHDTVCDKMGNYARNYSYDKSGRETLVVTYGYRQVGYIMMEEGYCRPMYSGENDSIVLRYNGDTTILYYSNNHNTLKQFPKKSKTTDGSTIITDYERNSEDSAYVNGKTYFDKNGLPIKWEHYFSYGKIWETESYSYSDKKLIVKTTSSNGTISSYQYGFY
jgi:hypothetical protein